MGTRLTDVIVPELFNSYVTKRTMEKSALFGSGIIENNTEFNTLASQASPLVNMPFFADLTGESEQIIEGENLEDKGIKSKKDVATIIRRAAMWSSSDLSAALSGKDPMKEIAELVANFWERDMQKELIAILKGVFGQATSSSGNEIRMQNNLLDISKQTGNKANFNAESFIDAEQLLGDAKSQLTGICIHSATESYLRKQNLIQTVQPSSDVSFGIYQGKRVIVDDSCPIEAGVYTSYLFGEGAVAFGNGNPVGFIPTEIDRDRKKGSGVDYLINRRTFILHPRGVAFTGEEVAKTEGPSRAELAKGQNWKPVYEPKQIRVVAFKHKLG